MNLNTTSLMQLAAGIDANTILALIDIEIMWQNNSVFTIHSLNVNPGTAKARPDLKATIAKIIPLFKVGEVYDVPTITALAVAAQGIYNLVTGLYIDSVLAYGTGVYGISLAASDNGDSTANYAATVNGLTDALESVQLQWNNSGTWTNFSTAISPAVNGAGNTKVNVTNPATGSKQVRALLKKSSTVLATSNAVTLTFT